MRCCGSLCFSQQATAERMEAARQDVLHALSKTQADLDEEVAARIRLAEIETSTRATMIVLQQQIQNANNVVRDAEERAVLAEMTLATNMVSQQAMEERCVYLPLPPIPCHPRATALLLSLALPRIADVAPLALRVEWRIWRGRRRSLTRSWKRAACFLPRNGSVRRTRRCWYDPSDVDEVWREWGWDAFTTVPTAQVLHYQQPLASHRVHSRVATVDVTSTS